MLESSADDCSQENHYQKEVVWAKLIKQMVRALWFCFLKKMFLHTANTKGRRKGNIWLFK